MSKKLSDKAKDCNSSDWFENAFIEALEKIQNDFERGENSAALMQELIKYTYVYLSIDSNENGSLSKEKIKDLFGNLSVFLTQDAIGTKLATDNKSMAIGSIVESLIYFKMPRRAAIDAVSIWLGMSKTKVRTCNEKYRSRIPDYILKDSRKFEVTFLMSSYRRIIDDLMSNDNAFPCDHPKAKVAFTNLKIILQKDYVYNTK